MLTTRFTELIGCTVPIQQAPMSTLATLELAAAVAGAGGLGMLAVWGVPPENIAASFDALPQDVAGAE